MTVTWRFDIRPAPGLPPLAWLARVHPAESLVDVTCGTSIRREADGFFEGTWVGPPGLTKLLDTTTVFGSGMVALPGALYVITPGHTMEGVYISRVSDSVYISNSLAALLTGADLQLDPDTDYVSRFFAVTKGIGASPIELPTRSVPLWFAFYENLLISGDGSFTAIAKPREKPFTTYAEYRRRLSDALASAIGNIHGYEPLVSLSSGYDSTAVAVIAAEHGCRRAATFGMGRRTIAGSASDSGEASARRLGMEVEVFDRLEYLGRADFPEAEFLATGMSGEDVIYSTMDKIMRRSLLLTGTRGGGVWRMSSAPRTSLWRAGLDGSSLTEQRLRLDCVFVPLPVFGMTEQPSILAIAKGAEMGPYSVGGRYDEPVARRISEEAGLPRGSFAVHKRAASSNIHTAGADALSPATRAALGHFAAAEGRSADFPKRFRVARRHRLAIALAKFAKAERLVGGLLARRRRLVHFEPEIGALLLRWAVAVVQPRYADLAPDRPLDRTTK